METAILVATLIFAAVAAVAAVFAARWEWLDRPQHAWRYRRRYQNLDQTGRVSIQVLVEGTALFHNVLAGTYGPGVTASDGWKRENAMVRGSDPIELSATILPPEKGDAWVEVRWITFRPSRQYGERVNLHTNEFQEWKWRWPSLRVRPRPGEPWWKAMPHRTSGGWKAVRKSPRAEIPTEGTGLESAPTIMPV